MIFTPENALKVLRGEKTETRRVKKDGEYYAPVIGSVFDQNNRLKWCEGRDYAIQPGRGKHAICRVKLVEIRMERLQAISWESAWNEGCSRVSSRPPVLNFQDLWESINTAHGTRWQDNPLVWVLHFGEITERYEDRIAPLEAELREKSA